MAGRSGLGRDRSDERRMEEEKKKRRESKKAEECLCFSPSVCLDSDTHARHLSISIVSIQFSSYLLRKICMDIHV